MNKKLIKIVGALTAVFMGISSLAACGGNSGNAEEKSAESTGATAESTVQQKKDPVTLNFLIPPNAVNQLDEVEAEFERLTKDTLNTKIDWTLVSFDDLGQKVTVKLAAGEKIDSVFSAPWTTPSLQQNVSKGLFKNLDSYFNNDKYPGLKKAFPKPLLDNNSFYDANNENHVYGIPFTHSYQPGTCIYYRADLAEKFGISEIKTWEDMTAYWDKTLQNEKGVVPFSWLGTTNNLADWYEGWTRPYTDKVNYNFSSTVYSVLNDDNSTITVANHFNPFLDADFVNRLPSPLNTVDPYRQYEVIRDWYKKGYLEKDILSQKDSQGQFLAGKAASYCSSLDTYDSVVAQLTSGVPGAKIGYFIPYNSIRENVVGQIAVDFKAWNFACIPTTSENADRTMEFFNWIFEDQKNHDLFELGIEGKNWEAVGNDKYKLPGGVDASQNYNLVGFQLTWTPSMQRYSATTPDDVLAINKMMADEKTFVKRIDAGFSFVSDSVKSEQAKCNDLATLARGVGCGVVEDYKQAIDDINKKYEQAGVTKIRAEYKKQFEAFMKTNPVNN